MKYKLENINCVLCGEDNYKVLGTRGKGAKRGVQSQNSDELEMTVVKCRNCKIIYPNPFPFSDYQQFQEDYSDIGEYFNFHDTSSKRKFVANLLNRIEKIYGTKGRLLDIGAGRGEMLLEGKEKGWEVVGIEPSKEFAMHIKDQLNIEVINCHFEDIKLKSRDFDAVSLLAVLNHVTNPMVLMKNVNCFLKLGGICVIDVENEGGIRFQVGNLYNKLRMRRWVTNLSPTFPPFHLFGFTPKSLNILLEKAGFKILECKFYGGNADCFKKGKGFFSFLEYLGYKSFTYISNFSNWGSYVQLICRKIREV